MTTHFPLSPILESPSTPVSETDSTAGGPDYDTMKKIAGLERLCHGVLEGQMNGDERMTKLENVVTNLHTSLKEYRADMETRLTTITNDMERMIFAAMDKYMQTRASDKQPQQLVGQGSNPSRYVPPNQRQQVQNTSFPEHTTATVDAVGVAGPHETHRHNLLKNVELPIFEGKSVYSWLARIERYFRIQRSTDQEKLELVSVSLAEDALGWYNHEYNMAPFQEWEQFVDAVLIRFGNVQSRGPCQSFMSIQQTGSVDDYVRRFEDLSSQCPGMEDKQREGIFLNGLTPVMREVVLVMKPNTLREMIGHSRAMEHSLLSQEMAETQMSVEHHQIRQEGDQATHQWKYKNIALAQSPRPRLITPPEVLDEKRRKGICFRCDGKYFAGHKCPNSQLQLITIMNGFELEVLEENHRKDNAEEWENYKEHPPPR